jgi:hypothetical protein
MVDTAEAGISWSCPLGQADRGVDPMLADVLIAIVIVAIAAVLGLVVHPLLWFVAVLAILMLVGRHHGGRRSRNYV